jgi:Alpha-L-fucosidase
LPAHCDGPKKPAELSKTVDESDSGSCVNPEKFDAKVWIDLAKAAGMKYITSTLRHHDALRISDWNIVQRTPYGKDPLKMLADECHRQGIKLFFYYSQLDWHNPDFHPRGKTQWTKGCGITAGQTKAIEMLISIAIWTGNYESCSRIIAQSPASGSTECGINRMPMAFAEDLRTDPSIAACSADYPEPSPEAKAWGGCADAAEGSSGTKHRRLQY